MPRIKAADARDIEDIILQGCRILAGQEKPKYMDAIQELNTCHGVAVPYHTLHNRFLEKTVHC